jgi:C4-dicarboxylate-specific signal transduction histidine kinase
VPGTMNCRSLRPASLRFSMRKMLFFSHVLMMCFNWAWATLKARIETLEAELAKLEASAAVHRADFERERERCERLMAEVLKATAELMAAREAAARIAGKLAALQSRPWWRRLVG